MRTTLDLPDTLFRQARAEAARRGLSFASWLREAVQRHLGGGPPNGDRPWMRHVGKLDREDAAHLREVVEHASFSRVEPEDLR